MITETTKTDRTATSLDAIVGARIKQRRKELGISQQNLATDLGLTFQQIQKYEKAINRITVGRLFQIAQILSVSVMYFFGEDLPMIERRRGERRKQDRRMPC